MRQSFASVKKKQICEGEKWWNNEQAWLVPAVYRCLLDSQTKQAAEASVA
jgi:hypothetical protein